MKWSLCTSSVKYYILLERKFKIMCNRLPVTFIFRNTRHRPMAQAIEWSKNGRHVISKRLPPISVQTAVYLTAFSRTRRNLLVSCYAIFNTPGTDCINVLFQVFPQKEQPIGVRRGGRGGHAIGPRRAVYLPGFVCFTYCLTSSL
jgi:hypothetical protein